MLLSDVLEKGCQYRVRGSCMPRARNGSQKRAERGATLLKCPGSEIGQSAREVGIGLTVRERVDKQLPQKSIAAGRVSLVLIPCVFAQKVFE